MRTFAAGTRLSLCRVRRLLRSTTRCRGSGRESRGARGHVGRDAGGDGPDAVRCRYAGSSPPTAGASRSSSAGARRLIVVISIGAALDGGAHAALALAYFLPLSFSALSYPTKAMVAGHRARRGSRSWESGIVVGGASRRRSSSCSRPPWPRRAGWPPGRRATTSGTSPSAGGATSSVAHLAYHDRSPGCPTARSSRRRRAQAIAHGRHRWALLAIDLDDFKVVNDSLGHAAGDGILCRIAERPPGERRGQGLLARQGGDEFADPG